MRAFSFISAISVILFGVLFLKNASADDDYTIKPVHFTKVKLSDRFWAPRIETNNTVTIRHCFQKCEETGRIDNFDFAAGVKKGVHSGYYFNDSDVYKVIESAAYALWVNRDPGLEAYVDGVIAKIAAAQEEDGYLYTTLTALNPDKPPPGGPQRWASVARAHELYCLGHLFEAATAYYQATGKRALLDVAIKSADLVCKVFGPGKCQEPPGHEEIEIGLVKLYRVTGDKKYLDMARFFLDVRGKPLEGRQLRGEYQQDHKPVREQDEVVGHAVRAAYLYSGMAEVAALSGDESYVGALNRLWPNLVEKKLYITGGIGATGAGESFGGVYELPNMSAYCETCSSIANVFWTQRLFLLHGEAKYLDVLERTLYNALLAGYDMDGRHFFYPNALESVGQHERSEWFECACCPPNVARLMASLPGYFYAVSGDRLYVNFFAAGEAVVEVAGREVGILQETGYPWDGSIKINVDPGETEAEFAVLVRIPGWALGRPLESDLYRYLSKESSEVTLKVNGEQVGLEIDKGFAVVDRTWRSGDLLELELPMVVRRVLAHDNVVADRGRVALERGPIVFCAEWPDNEGGHVRNLLLSDDTVLTTEFWPDLLSGVQVIEGRATAYEYRDNRRRIERRDQEFAAIPYYAWSHRGRGEMAVWLAREEAAVHPLNEPTLASTSKVTASFGQNPESVNDQLEPEASSDEGVPFFHWWPHKGTAEWIQYDFPEPKEVSTVDVYWFDDTEEGECRVPASWRVLYKAGEEWLPVYTTDVYGVERDRFNRVLFETVMTSAVKLEIQSQQGFAGGIHEWSIK
jgi:DUF1680 family protein